MKKTKLSFVILSLAASFTFSSCATIFTGTKQNIQVNSTPPGATIAVNGINQGITPGTVQVKRSDGSKVVSLTLEGYETKRFSLMSEFNPVAVINLTNIIGWAIDFGTGALWKYPKTFYFELEPEDSIGNPMIDTPKRNSKESRGVGAPR